MQPVPVVAVRHSASNMDFQFTHYLGNVHAKCSMEHIALANWFNSEVRSNPQAFLTALSACEQIKNNDEVTLICIFLLCTMISALCLSLRVL